jgi:protein-tyrosine phosphatase
LRRSASAASRSAPSPFRVAIGNHREARDAALLRREGVRSALSLDRTLREGDAAELGLAAVEAVPLEDGPGNDPRLFRRAVDALADLAADSGPVLVQCHAGRSRSAVVVAAHLMRSLGLGADEALARVAAKRQTAVAAGLVRGLDGLD